MNVLFVLFMLLFTQCSGHGHHKYSWKIHSSQAKTKRNNQEADRTAQKMTTRLSEGANITIHRFFSTDDHEVRVIEEVFSGHGEFDVDCQILNTCSPNKIVIVVSDYRGETLFEDTLTGYGWHKLGGSESDFLKISFLVQSCSSFIVYNCSVESHVIESEKEVMTRNNNQECSCGRFRSPRPQVVSQRILGGFAVPLGKLPWVVKIVTFTKENQYSLCGGAIISPIYIVTAAHCFDRMSTLDRIFITVGEVAPRKITNTNARVNHIIVHEKYNEADDDIAIIQLQDPLQFRPHVQPVCLPFGHTRKDWVGKVASVSGWGQTSDAAKSIPLMETFVEVMNSTVCEQAFDRKDLLSAGMMCASASNTDACDGDSGGPMSIDVNGHHKLIGIVSWGIGCASRYPGIYADITHYLDWIVNATGESFCWV